MMKSQLIFTQLPCVDSFADVEQFIQDYGNPPTAAQVHKLTATKPSIHSTDPIPH